MVEPKSPKCTMPSYVLEGVMTRESKAKPMCALRLPKSMRIEAVEIAKREGISPNHFIALAVAEKIARLEVLHSRTPDSDKADLQEEGFAVIGGEGGLLE
jgi:hypothetical protein